MNSETFQLAYNILQDYLIWGGQLKRDMNDMLNYCTIVVISDYLISEKVHMDQLKASGEIKRFGCLMENQLILQI